MLLGGNQKEKLRKANLKALEDKRLAFAQSHRGLQMAFALFVQRNGGFDGVAIAPEGIYLMTAPGPGDEEDFTLERMDRCRAHLRDEKIEPQGAGGILGFGKKGGQGYTLGIECPGRLLELTFVSGFNFLMEIAPGAKNPLLNPKRRPGNANIVWDMQSVPYAQCREIFARWHTMLNEFAPDQPGK